MLSTTVTVLKCSKILNTFLFLFSNKMFVFMKTLIRLLFRSSLIWFCTVCLGLFGRQLVLKMLIFRAGIHKNACQNSKQGRP